MIETLDLAQHVREQAFVGLLKTSAPVSVANLAQRLGLASGALEPVAEDLVSHGWLDRDDGGRIVGSGGLSLSTGRHRLEIGGRAFHTWCAFDAIGIPAALGSDAHLATECGVCGGALQVAITGGRPTDQLDARLWLAAGGDDLRADFCNPTVLLCSEAHGREWARQRTGHGQLVDLATAEEEGRRMWAGYARAAGVKR